MGSTKVERRLQDTNPSIVNKQVWILSEVLSDPLSSDNISFMPMKHAFTTILQQARGSSSKLSSIIKYLFEQEDIPVSGFDGFDIPLPRLAALMRKIGIQAFGSEEAFYAACSNSVKEEEERNGIVCIFGKFIGMFPKILCNQTNIAVFQRFHCHETVNSCLRTNT
jgi:hypothetical protein